MSRGKERTRAYRSGLLAETIAALYLRLKGWRIVARREKTPVGEIDIIARKGDVTAFIEVKKRVNRDAALESITPRQRQRIVRAAQWWLSGKDGAAHGACRFDLITLNGWMWPAHIASAFEAEDADG